MRVGNQYILKQIEHVLADAIEFKLDHLAVLVDELEMATALVRLTVLNRANSAPRSTPASHRVLVGD